ncbi:MAG: Qat anti-phage system ATPase QatA [Acidobacteriaceae bacterium]|jgi:predicted KAP-like P-loop ATPase
MILSDNETKVDLLNNEPIAKTIVTLLRKRPDNPVTIGVHGDWGAGKSSVLEMIESELEKDDRVLCLKFNGWRFQGFEDSKIALIEGIVTGLLDKRPLLTKGSALVKDIYHRINLLKLAKKGLGLGVAAAGFYAGHPHIGMMGLMSTLEGAVADPATFSKENVEAAIKSGKELIRDESKTTNVPDEIAGFRKAFDQLLKDANIDQLIVLIDDLDRCLPDTAIETLEAVRLFVFTSRTAFVVAADEAMIEYAVRKHFPDLPDTTGQQTYARNYLEKLIQIPFRIPALGYAETRIYVTLLLVGAELGEDTAPFEKLIGVARERLKRPWMGSVLDAETVKRTLGDKEKSAHNAMMLSDQIAPILAQGTRGNPRQIKRFLNTLLLRQASADARGFGDDVKLPVLAKLMLAERFITRVFDQIATASALSDQGICLDIAALEAAAKKSGETPTAKKPSRVDPPAKNVGLGLDVVKTENSPLLTEWLSSPMALDWARLSPPIGAIDLRPYLFVARDRKDFFGAATILGQVASIAEKLFGQKLAVQGHEADLRKLAPPEAAQVFEIIRGRVIGSDSFETEPAGAAGLGVLVKAQPFLQSNLLDFLESLPPNRIGPWACAGWENVIKEADMVRRFDQLLENWSLNGSQFLKASAANTLRTRKQGAR